MKKIMICVLLLVSNAVFANSCDMYGFGCAYYSIYSYASNPPAGYHYEYDVHPDIGAYFLQPGTVPTSGYLFMCQDISVAYYISSSGGGYSPTGWAPISKTKVPMRVDIIIANNDSNLPSLGYITCKNAYYIYDPKNFNSDQHYGFEINGSGANITCQ
jgi:hypothetical protein